MKQIISVYKSTILLIAVLITACGTGSTKKETGKSSIMVFAAASLTDVLTEVIDSFEVKYDVDVQTNMASSGTLARQIEQGGSTDIFLSASKRWADYIDSLGFISSGHLSEIARNVLVLITPVNSPQGTVSIDSSLNLAAMLGEDRLSMGDPAHVPAGKYALQALEYFGWYNTIDKQILPAKDVRSALMVVELEEVPAGIVYRTDAIKSEKVKVAGIFPEASHKPVVYMAGLCSDNENAKKFFAFLTSEEVKAILLKYGFK